MFRSNQILLLFIILITLTNNYAQKPTYLPLGDSYTICDGLNVDERWPNLIAETLKKNNLQINLTENPSRTGYTTDDLIKYELSFLKTEKPDIVTLLIGVNDYVRGYDTIHFHKNLIYMLDEIQKALKIPTNIILIAIPDYSVTPTGVYYANGRDVGKDLKLWNAIIQQEALKRSLPFVDIFPLTQKMKDAPELICKDGLHPSAKEVSLWADLIYPEMKKIVKKYF